MKKLNLFTVCMLLSLNFDIAASFVSKNPNDYLEGHYIYPRYLKQQRKLNDQTIVVLLARQKVESINTPNHTLHSFWAKNAHTLKYHHFPVEYYNSLNICLASELNSVLHQEYKQAQERDFMQADQYLHDLQKYQFIKTRSEMQSTSPKKTYDLPFLQELPKVNPFGVIGPKSITSPTTITGHRFSRSNSMN